jgi:ABC-type multidrug transport system fused ATPase/permease subunit
MDQVFTIHFDNRFFNIYIISINVKKCSQIDPFQHPQTRYEFISTCISLLYCPFKTLLTIAGTTHCRITNNNWHRLNLMKSFAYNHGLRRDIIVTGLAPWLTSEVHQANEKLGDAITKHPWSRRASSNVAFVRYIMHNVITSLEYIWLVREGIGQGMSLGTLQLIRTSTSEIISKLYSLYGSADSATRDWKGLIAYYRCLELEPAIVLPPNPVEYVSKSRGMKIEARNIRYKYDSKKKEEVLKGISFVINPGEMIAVVG